MDRTLVQFNEDNLPSGVSTFTQTYNQASNVANFYVGMRVDGGDDNTLLNYTPPAGSRSAYPPNKLQHQGTHQNVCTD